LEQLGVIVLLDAPAKVQLGVDNTSWIVGAKFKGVRMVPLGVHYVHYALADEKYQFKLGFFCVLTHQKRVVVRRWHTHYEDFLPVDEDTQRMYEHAVAVRDLDAYLGPYPVEKWSVWSLVSNYITQDVLDVLDPITPKQWTIEEEYKAENKQEEEVEPELEAEADGEVIDEEAPES
jgi:A1 cistron-splicing factor AAR2